MSRIKIALLKAVKPSRVRPSALAIRHEFGISIDWLLTGVREAP